jgi:hypothetical protein
MKKGVPLTPCPNDFVCSEALAFLDIPHDVRVNAVAFLGQQITTNVSKKEGPQHLKTVYRTGEIWRLLVYHAVHFCEPLGTGSTNPRDFWIDAAQPKVRAEPNAPRRPRTLQRDLETVNAAIASSINARSGTLRAIGPSSGARRHFEIWP